MTTEHNWLLGEALFNLAGARVTPTDLTFPRDIGFHIYDPRRAINVLIYNPKKYKSAEVEKLLELIRREIPIPLEVITTELNIEGGDAIYMPEKNKILLGNKIHHSLANVGTDMPPAFVEEQIGLLQSRLTEIFGDAYLCQIINTRVKHVFECFYYHLDVCTLFINGKFVVLNLKIFEEDTQATLHALFGNI